MTNAVASTTTAGAMTLLAREPGSFRDPKGSIYRHEGRILRTITSAGLEDYEFVRATPLIRELIDEGKLLDEREVPREALGEEPPECERVLEHPLLPFVSYPYEWCFYALRDAALLQLELCTRALRNDVMLSDASAYNIQFDGTAPVFIDHLSFTRYHEGQIWEAHSQFCEQFLNPLLLHSAVGIPHHAWYRGSLGGIPVADLNRVLPLRSKLSPTIFMHVTLQDRLNRRGAVAAGEVEPARISKSRLITMMQGLHAHIEDLTPRRAASTWQDYATQTSYSSDEAQTKRQFVTKFVAATRPQLVADLGCNTGAYSRACLEAGAKRVIGVDADAGAVDGAYLDAKRRDIAFTPLFADLSNPSPAQGWAGAERGALFDRLRPDALIALALVHHLAIANNIPLAEVVRWLTEQAPTGVIEFVPKNDPMVQTLLALRNDVFDSYSEDTFESALESRCEIVESQRTSASGRMLYWYAAR